MQGMWSGRKGTRAGDESGFLEQSEREISAPLPRAVQTATYSILRLSGSHWVSNLRIRHKQEPSSAGFPPCSVLFFLLRSPQRQSSRAGALTTLPSNTCATDDG